MAQEPKTAKATIPIPDLRTGIMYPREGAPGEIGDYFLIEKKDGGYDFHIYDKGGKITDTVTVKENGNDNALAVKLAARVFKPVAGEGPSSDKVTQQHEALPFYAHEFILHGRSELEQQHKPAKNQAEDRPAPRSRGRADDTPVIAAMEQQFREDDPKIANKMDRLSRAVAHNDSPKTPGSLLALGAVGAGLALAGTAPRKGTDEEGKKRRWGFANVATIGLGATVLLTAMLAAKRGADVDGFFNKIKAGWSQGGGRGL